jgi:hypothetical protein
MRRGIKHFVVPVNMRRKNKRKDEEKEEEKKDVALYKQKIFFHPLRRFGV